MPNTMTGSKKNALYFGIFALIVIISVGILFNFLDTSKSFGFAINAVGQIILLVAAVFLLKWFKEGNLEDHIARILYAKLGALLCLAIGAMMIYSVPAEPLYFRASGILVGQNYSATVRLNRDPTTDIVLQPQSTPGLFSRFSWPNVVLKQGTPISLSVITAASVPMDCAPAAGTADFTTSTMISTCTYLPPWALSGTVNGLAQTPSSSVQIRIDSNRNPPAADDEIVTVNGANPLFASTRGVFNTRPFRLVIAQQPPGLVCACSGPSCSSTAMAGPITTVQILCTGAPTAAPAGFSSLP
jgi:hypothetical protein